MLRKAKISKCDKGGYLNNVYHSNFIFIASLALLKKNNNNWFKYFKHCVQDKDTLTLYIGGVKEGVRISEGERLKFIVEILKQLKSAEMREIPL